MSETIDYNALAPEIVMPLFDGHKLLGKSSIEPSILTLIQIRASQINGCAFCLALHVREGQALGESLDRLTGVSAWRECPWYTERERRALEWTEALTTLSDVRPADTLLDAVREQFSEREVIYLTLAINNINAWNRLNVGFKTPPERAEEVFKMMHPSSH